MRRRKYGRKSSRKPLRRHAWRRAYERFGINLTHEKEVAIVRSIQAREAKFLERESNVRVHYAVEVDGTAMRVVYHKEKKCLVTCLPLEPRPQSTS